MNISVRKFLICVIFSVFFLSSSAESQHKETNPAMSQEETKPELPKHLIGHPSELYIRHGGKIINAPDKDLTVARGYVKFPNKGKMYKDQRITIMTAKTDYKIGEEVRVIHILEALESGQELYIMGPKLIEDEFIDGKLASPARTSLAVYDGKVTKGPGVDFNYEISSYTFDKLGWHTIQWKGGGHPIQGNLELESNLLHIFVTK